VCKLKKKKHLDVNGPLPDIYAGAANTERHYEIVRLLNINSSHTTVKQYTLTKDY